MKHVINIDNWERRDNYRFFQGFANSWYSLTTEVECSAAFDDTRRQHTSFFQKYLYAVLRAVNEVPALRYRLDKNGDVCFYDQVDVITPIAVSPNQFYTIRVPWQKDFVAFSREVQRLIDSIPENADPYAIEKEVIAVGDYDVILLSALPRLYFTSLTHTQQRVGQANLYPLMNVGKAVGRGDCRMMPIAIAVDHQFVDGSHLSDFFEIIQEELKR